MSQVEKDFETFEAALREKGWLPLSPDPQFGPRLKSCHKAIYTCLMWEAALGRMPKRARIFLKELRSDAIISLVLAVQGHNRASAHALRSMIEDLTRMVYYTDHEIEFLLLNESQDAKNQMSFDGLFTYLNKHPRFGKHVMKLKLVDRLRTHYNVTSKYVHGTNVEYMNSVKVLDSIVYDSIFFSYFAKTLTSIAQDVSAVLTLFRQETFLTLSSNKRMIILNSLRKSCREYILSLETTS